MVYTSIMRSFLIFLILSTVCFISNAQKFTFNQGGATKSGYYEELPYEDINGKLFVTVELKGIKYRFLFDTGAPDMISNKLAQDLNAPEIYRDTLNDVNGSKAVTTIIKANIILGTTTFAEVPAIKGWPAGILDCFGIDGVIGSNLLRSSIVSINSKQHLIIITDQKNKLNLNNASSTKMVLFGLQSEPLVQLLIKDKELWMVEFDSGDNAFLRLTKEMTDKMDKLKVYDTIAKGYGANTYGMLGLQKVAAKYRIKIPYMNISKARFNNVITETNKTGIPGIGTGLLKYGTVTLDFIHQKFYFDADSAATDLSAKQWPLTPAVVDGKLIVGVVWDTFTDKALPGEQIIAIDDTGYSQVNFCDLLKKGSILGKAETAVLTIKDKDGNLRKVTIAKQ